MLPSNLANLASLPIAVDVMGADLGPLEIIEGCLLALNHYPTIPGLILVGNQEVIMPFLKARGLENSPKLSVFQASQVIEMDEKPIWGLKQKKDSSMMRALELVQNGQASAVLSCGNTGSLLAGGMMKIRTLEGIERPALATIIPTQKGHFILIDSGANPTPEPIHLLQSAILGYHYAAVVLQLEKPRVGLLTIGIEEGKGNELVIETHNMLKNLKSIIDYRGPVEGFHLFESAVDVVICDGFVGNILLKTCESLFASLKGFLRVELEKNWLRKAGAFLSQGVYKTMKEKFSPEQYGGAPLLGLQRAVIKAHGSSNRHSIKGAIKIAHQIVKHDMYDQVKDTLQKSKALL